MATICKKCAVVLDDTNGRYRYTRKSDGVRTYDTECRKCHAERLAIWAQEHKESRRIYNKAYRLKHLDSLKKYQKDYYSKPENREHRAVREHIRHKQLTESLWKEGLDFFGPCECCGESRREFLTIDHRNGDGAKRRLNGEKGGWMALMRFRSMGWPESLKKEFRILCMNCNHSLGQFGYCPHNSNGMIPAFSDDRRYTRKAKASKARKLAEVLG